MKIAEIFDMLAQTTWRSLERAYDRRIRMGEDAITTYNLLTIDSSGTASVVVEDTRIDESQKGCDWEFWIGSDRFGWRRYAIQAKRIAVSTGRYQSLAHNVSGTPQIDILECYSQANNACPLYCFYNFDNTGSNNWNCNHPKNIELLGCSVTPSSVVRNALNTRGARTFTHIHTQPQTLPWSCLVKCPLIAVPRPKRPLCYYEKLPRSIERIRESRTSELLVDAPETFSFDLGLRPRWVGIIDQDETNDG